ncbi:hypothetical protein KIW84_064865 [Lathyrus oleraceus]|uniref:Uncharacterized protein n=1 Tax=Pisum sativum TaxID=3888 RepID=A0A9D4WDS2_PEA|nr:hypothetical protein KIW84_064865 [Pisum sativum]
MVMMIDGSIKLREKGEDDRSTCAAMTLSSASLSRTRGSPAAFTTSENFWMVAFSSPSKAVGCLHEAGNMSNPADSMLPLEYDSAVFDSNLLSNSEFVNNDGNMFNDNTIFDVNDLPRQFNNNISKPARKTKITQWHLCSANCDESDAEKIIEKASNTSFADQAIQVQENVHTQVKTFCAFMDEILLPNEQTMNDPLGLSQQASVLPRRSGLSLAVAGPQTRPLSQAEVSQKLKDQLGYTLNIKPSQIPHKDAGQGLFLDGAVDVGSVVAFYPGVVYSPAYYRYIPGYPKVGAQNPYLITRYDGNVINAQPWGSGGDKRELWNGRNAVEVKPDTKVAEKGSDRVWKVLSKPLVGKGDNSEVIERRNPLALAHFANHPSKGVLPNVTICPELISMISQAKFRLIKFRNPN